MENTTNEKRKLKQIYDQGVKDQELQPHEKGWQDFLAVARQLLAAGRAFEDLTFDKIEAERSRQIEERKVAMNFARQQLPKKFGDIFVKLSDLQTEALCFYTPNTRGARCLAKLAKEYSGTRLAFKAYAFPLGVLSCLISPLEKFAQEEKERLEAERKAAMEGQSRQTSTPGPAPVMKAKYGGSCQKCCGHIQVGDDIFWERGTGAWHVHCPSRPVPAPTAKPVPVEPQYPFPIYQIQGGSGEGCPGWEVGQILRNTPQRIQRGQPEFLAVLTTSSKYYREDGWSFGVGDESGSVFWATCREASPEESAPLRAEIEHLRAQLRAQQELEEIAKTIWNQGERPVGTTSMDGEQVDLGEGQNLYGGGKWFVIDSQWIWFVRNNGADGDDWSLNNIATGGAGAIGWRIPFDPELADRIRSLADQAWPKLRLAAKLRNRQPVLIHEDEKQQVQVQFDYDRIREKAFLMVDVHKKGQATFRFDLYGPFNPISPDAEAVNCLRQSGLNPDNFVQFENKLLHTSYVTKLEEFVRNWFWQNTWC